MMTVTATCRVLVKRLQVVNNKGEREGGGGLPRELGGPKKELEGL